MKDKLPLLILLLGIMACKNEVHLTKIEGHPRIEINDSLQGNEEIDAFVAPYRAHVNKDLDSVLAYAKDTYAKDMGELNTAIGNFMADAVFELSQPIFKQRTGKDLDMAILNHGGIRDIISKGNLTSRTAYKIMPFENAIVVTPMNAEQIRAMLNFLAEKKRAHPISNLKLVLNADYSINTALINGKPIESSKTYYVATNDYLYKGGSSMTFLKSKDTVYNLNYKVRNSLIDYLKSIDTLQPTTDDRFIKLSN